MVIWVEVSQKALSESEGKHFFWLSFSFAQQRFSCITGSVENLKTSVFPANTSGVGLGMNEMGWESLTPSWKSEGESEEFA